MGSYNKNDIYYFVLDWHIANITPIKVFLDTIYRHTCKHVDKFVVKIIFKEHTFYFKYMNNRLYVFTHLSKYNCTPYISDKYKLFVSPDINADCNETQLLGEVPVIIPDYSSTDVGVGKPWPTKVFSPFVDSTAWPPYSLTDSYNSTGGLYYNLGFIVSKSATVCEPTWGTYYPAEAGPLNDQIKAIRNLGGDVTISFGGAANVPLHIVAPDSTALFNQYQAFTEGYKLTRIDFDLEGPWIASAYNQANINNSQALKMLQDYYASQGKSISVWFTLPVLPTGLTPDGINILQLALSAGVDIGGVNVMTMDYGDWAAPNPEGKMGEYGIQAITALQGQLNTLYNGSKTDAELWAMIGTTPMLGVNDVQTEIFTQADARQTLDFANSKNIGMISMWSSNRDMTGKSGIVQTDYEFANIFSPYTN